ncbi:MAG: hypothetical protein KVP17_004348 [Porospora cf. gigantea B]|nr:MAG: hypothetical protein KVP17_004348 [Porospora cf. gigantea B]
MYDEGHIEPTINPCMRLLCLNAADRLQYLREMTSSRSVLWLEEARWFTIDATSEPRCYSEAQTLVSLISDMSLLLTLLGMSAVSDAEDMMQLVVLLVLTYFGETDGTSRSASQDGLAYCLVVHALNVIRCVALDSVHKRSASRHALDILGLQRRVALSRVKAVHGFCVYMTLMEFDSLVSIPLSTVFTDGKDLSKVMRATGLWPLFLNPAMLVGEQWTDVKDRIPFKGYDLHPSIANTRFPSRVRLLSLDVEALAAKAAALAPHLASMRQSGCDQKDGRHAVINNSPLAFSKLSQDELHPQDVHLALHRTISTQNLIHQPNNLLLATKDQDDKCQLRCSVAVAVARGLTGSTGSTGSIGSTKSRSQDWRRAFCFCPLAFQQPQDRRILLNLVAPYIGGVIPPPEVIRPLLDMFSASLRDPSSATLRDPSSATLRDPSSATLRDLSETTPNESNPWRAHGNAEAIARVRRLYEIRKSQMIGESHDESGRKPQKSEDSPMSENRRKKKAPKNEDSRIRRDNKTQPRSVKLKNGQSRTINEVQETVESFSGDRPTLTKHYRVERVRPTKGPVLLTSVLVHESESRLPTIGCVEACRLGSYTC